jgi:hypothetical protein
MNTHHLTLGVMTDFLSGNEITDTHDERYRQKIARLLVMEKGFDRNDIRSSVKLTARAQERKAILPIDFVVHVNGLAMMVIRYGPGSIITRHRPALAASRLLAPHQIPVVVVTNGEDADVLSGKTGTHLGSGFDAIPDRETLHRIAGEAPPAPIDPMRAERESMLLYAYDVDGSCPCDSDICRITE